MGLDWIGVGERSKKEGHQENRKKKKKKKKKKKRKRKKEARAKLYMHTPDRPPLAALLVKLV